MKRTTLSRIAIPLFLYPWLVSYAPVDSLVTELGLSFASGREVRISRDCDGNVTRRDNLPFTNVAASVTHQIAPDITLGIASGYASVRDNGHWLEIVRDTSSVTLGLRDVGVFYAKPKVAFDWRYFGISAGGMISTPGHGWSEGLGVAPMASLRIGSREGFAWETQVLDNDLLVGPAWVYTGLAFAFPVGKSQHRYGRLHTGVGGGPYEFGFQVRAEIPFEDLTIDPGFFVDPIEGSGFGFFARLRYRLNAPNF